MTDPELLHFYRQNAFNRACADVAETVVRKYVAKDAELKAAIEDLIKECAAKMLRETDDIGRVAAEALVRREGASVTEEELREIERLYGDDVVGSDLIPDDLLAYENQHRAHTRALIAEVRLLRNELRRRDREDVRAASLRYVNSVIRNL